MRVPAALRRWVAEHNQQLSASTRSELDVITSIIDASSLSRLEITDLAARDPQILADLFPPERAGRAASLIGIVAEWSATQSPAGERWPVLASIDSAANPEAELHAPTFLRSDRVDEDDNARLFGSARRRGRARSVLQIMMGVLSIGALAVVGVVVWLWASQESTSDLPFIGENVAESNDSDAAAADRFDAEPDGTGVASVEPTVAPTEEPASPTGWADTETILNTGLSEIVASTYPVSPTNRAVLTGHSAAVVGIGATSEGRVITAGSDSQLVDWGTEVAIETPFPIAVPAPATALIVTADQQVVAADATGTLMVFDIDDPDNPTPIAVHESPISILSETLPGELAVGSVDGVIVRLPLVSPGDAVTLDHPSEVTAAVGFTDGRLVTTSIDGAARVWPATGTSPTTINVAAEPLTAVGTLDDGTLAVATISGKIHVVAPIADSSPILTIDAHNGPVRALLEITHPTHGRVLASGGDDSTIRLWDSVTGERLQQLDGHGQLVSALATHPDGRLLSASADGTGRVWNLELPAGRTVITPFDLNLARLAPWREDRFVAAGVDGRVALVSTVEGSDPEPITDHESPVVGIAVMPNGDIVSVDATSVLRLNQVGPEAGEPIELQLAPGATALAQRGELGVVTGHADGTVRFSDFTSEVGVVSAHGAGVTAIATLSGGLVATASEDETVRIVDFDNPDLLPVFDLHTAPVTAVTELSDGRIASAGADGIFVWSITDMGQEHIRLAGNRSITLSLHGLPNGRLLSTSEDGRVRIWDLAQPEADALTMIDVPGIVNPELIQAPNGLFVSGAGRGYVLFTLE